MGKVGKVIAGVGLIVTGAVIGVVTGNWTLAFVMASSGVGILTQPRIPKLSSLDSRQAIAFDNRVGAQQPIPLVYGTTKLAGVLADVRVHPTAPERKLLVLVTTWCHGSRDGSGIYSIDSVWFDDRKAIDGITVQAPFSNAAEVAKTAPWTPPTGGQKFLAFQHHLGTFTDTVDSRLNQMFASAWPTTSKGLGLAYSRLELWYSTDIYPSGIPDAQAVIRGNKVYDPRDGTWKFSTNPALVIYDFLASAVYGFGIPEQNLEAQSFIDMANYCDELITNPAGGTMKRFEFNGWVDTSKAVQDNLAELCTSCRGQVINEGDIWRLLIRRARTASTFKINAKTTLEGSWQFVLSGNDSAPNIARANFVNPDNNYTTDTVQFPEPGQPNSYLTEDNGFENVLTVDLPYTQNRGAAQSMMITLLKQARRGTGATVTLKEEALDLRVGDVVPVTQSTPGWVDKLFDVVALLIAVDGSVQAILSEYDPVVYDEETQFAPPEPPSQSLPNPFVCVPPTSLVLVSQDQAQLQNDGGYVPRIRATWTKADDPFVDFYEIQARRLLSTDVIDVAPPFDSSHFSSSGVTVASLVNLWNDDVTANAFHTDTAVPGAVVKLDCGAGNLKEYTSCRLYASTTPTTASQWAVDYSDDGSLWGTAVSSGFAVAAVGYNTVTWASVGPHRFWRIRLLNTPGSGPYINEMQFKEPAWDNFGRVHGGDAPLVYIYPATPEYWQVRIRAVNQLGVKSIWLQGLHLVTVPDPRPQILSITLTTAHSDTHSDVPHQDVAHGDTGHSDAHSDSAHVDHSDHGDAHGDNAGHFDAAHADFHSDVPHDIDHVDDHTDSAHGDHSDGHADTHTDTDHNDTAHDDSHADGPFDLPHTDGHSDNPHSDHTDSGFSHSDTSHSDSHTDTGHADTAHSDAHTDAHSDGQHGVGIAIQADSDSASVKAVARKVSSNKLVNGGGETGTVGSQAPSWAFALGQALNVANDFFHGGSKSLKFVHSSSTQSYSNQVGIPVTAGKRYRLEGWIKTTALAGTAGGPVLDLQCVLGTMTVVESSAPFTDYSATNVKVLGLVADGAVHDWTYVYLRFIPSSTTTLALYILFGYSGNVTGSAWFDDVGIFEDEPTVADVRTQPAVDGRNVSIELIDAATGAQIQLAPGDQVRVGALAYSLKGAGGVEGPLALASVGLFNVAPVGTDLWVPS